MTEEAERRPREMQEELEVEKKRKTEELEELAKEMEREYENRVKKALAQLRFSLCLSFGVDFYNSSLYAGMCIVIS